MGCTRQIAYNEWLDLLEVLISYMCSSPARDFWGYGPHSPNPQWPNNARVAVSFVLNLEEGAELTLSAGDERNESVYEVISETQGVPNLAMESHFEYGSRIGFWRVLDLFDRYGIKATMNVCGRAVETSPWMALEPVKRGHELCCHGYRWEPLVYMKEPQERENIRRTVRAIEQASGVSPVGWQTKASSTPNTRRLLLEHGGFLYDSDAYNDELPYFVEVSGKPHLVLPYSFDTNDMRFTNTETFRLAQDFSTYLIDSFNWLYQEGENSPRMMTVGLHTRIIGRPGRIWALQQFLEHIQAHERVWIARRDQIARHWYEMFG
ncbi:MAG: putative xylanase/chitin deacetylase [Phormidesmis priestleyi Ana]|uniref:Putative xylanase/chitin deacetylase n=1 Tax=Phormidesmis priestleyi Ana TaxID=1666911 RepID=A0A0P8BU80_9CYAN|nr:MAG: putative xylanase/chitin deacetylase [Phormidesmis priestleyi Ana]